MIDLEKVALQQCLRHFLTGGRSENPGGTVLCIAVKVAVFYQQIMKLTQNYDFYDFPMPVYARISIYIKKLGNFGYTDTHFT